MPSLPVTAEKLAAIRRIFANAGVNLPSHLSQDRQAPGKPVRPARQRSRGPPKAPENEEPGSPLNAQERSPGLRASSPTSDEEPNFSHLGDTRAQAHSQTMQRTATSSHPGPPVETPDTTMALGAPRIARAPDVAKRRKTFQTTIPQCLSQEKPKNAKAPGPKLPCDKKFAISKVHGLRRRLVNSQAYTKAFQTHSQGGSCEKRRDSFLSIKQNQTTSIFGGDVEISAYALTRNFICHVWELKDGSIFPYPETFARTDSATQNAHFLFSRTPHPEQRGEFLRNGHFDLLLPQENLPQGLENLEKLCPPNSPPLYRVPCPKNGHCLFFGMAFLDDLLTPTISDVVGDEISEDEEHVIGTSTATEPSTDSSFHSSSQI